MPAAFSLFPEQPPQAPAHVTTLKPAAAAAAPTSYVAPYPKAPAKSPREVSQEAARKRKMEKKAAKSPPAESEQTGPAMPAQPVIIPWGSTYGALVPGSVVTSPISTTSPSPRGMLSPMKGLRGNLNKPGNSAPAGPPGLSGNARPQFLAPLRQTASPAPAPAPQPATPSPAPPKTTPRFSAPYNYSGPGNASYTYTPAPPQQPAWTPVVRGASSLNPYFRQPDRLTEAKPTPLWQQRLENTAPKSQPASPINSWLSDRPLPLTPPRLETPRVPPTVGGVRPYPSPAGPVDYPTVGGGKPGYPTVGGATTYPATGYGTHSAVPRYPTIQTKADEPAEPAAPAPKPWLPNLNPPKFVPLPDELLQQQEAEADDQTSPRPDKSAAEAIAAANSATQWPGEEYSGSKFSDESWGSVKDLNALTDERSFNARGEVDEIDWASFSTRRPDDEATGAAPPPGGGDQEEDSGGFRRRRRRKGESAPPPQAPPDKGKVSRRQAKKLREAGSELPEKEREFRGEDFLKGSDWNDGIPRKRGWDDDPDSVETVRELPRRRDLFQDKASGNVTELPRKDSSSAGRAPQWDEQPTPRGAWDDDMPELRRPGRRGHPDPAVARELREVAPDRSDTGVRPVRNKPIDWPQDQGPRSSRREPSPSPRSPIMFDASKDEPAQQAPERRRASERSVRGSEPPDDRRSVRGSTARQRPAGEARPNSELRPGSERRPDERRPASGPPGREKTNSRLKAARAATIVDDDLVYVLVDDEGRPVLG
ncbi:MAG: hypothetical protein ACT4OM_12965 [Actinomycetota bacterium]